MLAGKQVLVPEDIYGPYLLEGETEELYDLQADPEELKDLASRLQQRVRLLALRGKAIAKLRRTEAPFVDKLPNVKKY